jgi:hypothetical protein
MKSPNQINLQPIDERKNNGLSFVSMKRVMKFAYALTNRIVRMEMWLASVWTSKVGIFGMKVGRQN